MRRLIVGGFVLALVCAGAGSASSPSLKASAAARERAAARQATALVHRFNAPPGAVRGPRPSGWGGALLRSGPSPPENAVDRVVFWRVRRSFSSVIAYVREHPPAGLRHWDSAESSPGQSPATAEDSYSRRGVRFLNVTVVELPGRVVIRLDAKVVWLSPRSPKETVPAATHEIDVTTSKASRQVTDPVEVAKIVRWFNALPVAPRTSPICGPAAGTAVTLVFRSANGKPLATASLPSERAWVCDEIYFTIRVKRQTPLVDTPYGRTFVQRVGKLLGLKLSAPRR